MARAVRLRREPRARGDDLRRGEVRVHAPPRPRARHRRRRVGDLVIDAAEERRAPAPPDRPRVARPRGTGEFGARPGLEDVPSGEAPPRPRPEWRPAPNATRARHRRRGGYGTSLVEGVLRRLQRVVGRDVAAQNTDALPLRCAGGCSVQSSSQHDQGKLGLAMSQRSKAPPGPQPRARYVGAVRRPCVSVGRYHIVERVRTMVVRISDSPTRIRN